MRAVLHDPEGPFWLRVVPLAGLVLPAILFGLGFHLYAWGLGFVLLCLTGVVPRLRPRPVDVELGVGKIELKNAGALSQTLSAKAVTGASTARTAEGVALSLQRRGRQVPTTLVFQTEDEVARVREALGIGHAGFGEMSWPLMPGAATTLAPAMRLIGAIFTALSMMLYFVGTLGDNGTLGSVLATLCLILAIPAGFLGFFTALDRGSSQHVALGPQGVRLQGFQRSHVPYQAVEGARVKDGLFELGVSGDRSLKARYRTTAFAGPALGREDEALLFAQLRAAVERAGGAGPRKREALTRIDTLRRGDEPVRDWLARIDVTASMLAQTGYRGGAIEKEDLWLTLADPDAEAYLRAAAGRVLLRVEQEPQARVRVETIVAAVRDEGMQKRMRVAIFPELDVAGSELESLEGAETSAQRRMSMGR